MSEIMTDVDTSFEMPRDLAARGFAVRPRAPADTDFLRELYISFRWSELEAAGWPDATRHAFLADQFRLQDHHYTTHYTTTAFLIITRDGAPAGRLYIDRGGAREIRLVDIILMATFIGQGIGSVIIRALLDEATRTGCFVGLHVESDNPARRLYQRLGFVDRRMEGPYYYMTWGDFTGEADPASA